ncbi:MAG: hypothetical protein RJA22_2066 [Verrucomicrobiota bacterium]
MALLLGLWLPGRGATLTATLDRNIVPVGESVTLSLTYEGVAAAEAPNLPPLPALAQAQGTSQRTEMSFINGRQSMKVIFDYRLVARQPGDVVIPPLQGRAGGAVLVSQPIQLKVIPPSAAAQAAQQQQQLTLSNLAFVRLIVPRTEVYVGEPIPVEMHLYFWGRAQDAHLPELQADGFSLGPMPPHSQTQTQVGNNPYNLVIRRVAATPARAGTLTLGPATSKLTLLLPNNDRRPRGFFDFGPSYTPVPVTPASEAVAIRVLPLPTVNVPPGFNGAIGSYRLDFEAGPTNLTAGDPVTLRLAITGNGPVEALAFPPQSDWRDFKTYPPSAKVELSDPLGLAGTKRFEQVVIPENHEIRNLPPLQFSFFDPQARAYRTLSSAAVPLNIRAAAASSLPPPALTNAAGGANPPADELIHIRPRLELARPAAPLLAVQPWFLGLQALPLAVWLGLLGWRKRAEHLANNPRLRRQREVAVRVRDGLRELRAHAGAQASAEFFATLFRVLQEQLGERLDIPATAITEAVVDERLRPRGLDDATLRSLHELFQACNAARYAPVSSAQELAALIPRVEAVLARLREMNP